MKNVLSIDFDFFIRENPMWDFGHNEENAALSSVIWSTRYMSINLYKETDIRLYADFPPAQLFQKLTKKGFTFSKKTQLFVADSHKYTYHILEASGIKANIYNMDAHHDMYGIAHGMDCGNWIDYANREKYVDGVVWIKPTWQREFEQKDEVGMFSDRSVVSAMSVYWDKLAIRKIPIDVVSMCRSSAWIPPHHDKNFIGMVNKFAHNVGISARILENLSKRRELTEVEAEMAFNDYQIATMAMMRGTK